LPKSINFNTDIGQVDITCYQTIPHEQKVVFNGVMIMFDLTDFKNTMSQAMVTQAQEFKVPIVMCGLKSDLLDQITPVQKKRQIKKLQKIIFEQDISYYDVSGKTNYNIDKPFSVLLKANQITLV
jgi:GTPase SAR1 family protein